MRQYGNGGLGLHVPSRNTGRGVYSYGKLKGVRPGSIGKPTGAQPALLARRGVLKGAES